MTEYKGYTGIFDFDPSIDAFHARVVGLQDVVTFEGRSIDELRREMEASVEDYLELCEEAGREPERPYRGEFLVRTTPEIHRAVATAAEVQGVSLNAWVASTLDAATSRAQDTGASSPEAASTPRKRQTRKAPARKSRGPSSAERRPSAKK